MDDSRLTLWTRRGLGLAAGGMVAVISGLTAPHASGKKKRCIRLLKPCRVGGRRCCHHNVCQSFDTGTNGTFFCCKGEGASCKTGQKCCPPLACAIEIGATVGTCASI